jgi:uncharacterized protein YdhG (YjbR/CyaY superfamily)
MAKTDYKTIDQYHSTFPADLIKRMQEIRGIVHKVVPDVEETISYQIPCFKYNGYLIYYSAYTNHISLSHPFSKEFLEHFKDGLKNYKVSKSAIQLPNDENLPLKFIKEIIEFRKSENVAKPTKKK